MNWFGATAFACSVILVAAVAICGAIYVGVQESAGTDLELGRVEVWHDEANSVTCWIVRTDARRGGMGIDCLPDGDLR